MPCGIAQRPEVPEGKLEEMIAHEDHLLGAGEHAKIGRETELERIFLDQAVAEGMKGRDLHIGIAVGHERVHPLLHLGRGLVREGQREHFRGSRLARGDEMGNAPGDHRGLAGARARDDEKGPRPMRDRLALGLCQPLQDALGAARGFRHQNRKAK